MTTGTALADAGDMHSRADDAVEVHRPHRHSRLDAWAGRSVGQRLSRAAGVLLLAAIIWLLVSRIGAIDWDRVGEALRAFDRMTLASAAGLALLAYCAAANYDVLGRRYAGHVVPVWRTFGINFIAYAFSLNLGALVGGWGLRMHLYARNAVAGRFIARILVFAVVTNWSGFVLVAGLVLLFAAPQLAAPWPFGETGSRLFGAALLLTVPVYLALCATGLRRGWHVRVRGVELKPPAVPIAALQFVLSSAHWLLVALCLSQLLPDGIPFTRVLAALFAASVIGAAAHVPGSIGVLEGSILILLGVPEREQVLAGLLAFRAVYYLLPLALAGLAYLVLEHGVPKRR